MLFNIVSVIHLLISVFLILVILLQQGKGADMGATFGGGGNTLFGASGADTLLIKVTTITAILFMGTSLYLAVAGRGGPGKFESKLFPGSGQPAATAPANVPLNAQPSTDETKPETAAPEAAAPVAAPAASEAPAAAAPATSAPAASEQPKQDPAAAPVAPAAAPVAAGK